MNIRSLREIVSISSVIACLPRSSAFCEMSVYHDEVEIEDFEYDEELETYFYPCPCGDRFEITKEDLLNGEEVATCPSCSLLVKVIYNQEDFIREKDTLTKEEPAKLQATN
ncbi:DPH3 homolog isoform X1 [Dermacentor silvarum]|uniref:DPH3 homolog isoform X1 n=2 Tax=Dermacentor silvarum TaxID=543639 RepID=UPI00189BDB90|nr:DPH3 homolog isoform X1 [Dermacentor silvarum]